MIYEPIRTKIQAIVPDSKVHINGSDDEFLGDVIAGIYAIKSNQKQNQALAELEALLKPFPQYDGLVQVMFQSFEKDVDELYEKLRKFTRK